MHIETLFFFILPFPYSGLLSVNPHVTFFVIVVFFYSSSLRLFKRPICVTHVHNVPAHDLFIYIFYTVFPFLGALSKSQFPVFTIYAQKTCLGIKPCERAWCFDRVQGYRLKGFGKKNLTASSRQDCLELCLGEREFSCR